MNWRAKIIKHNHEQRIAVYFEKDAKSSLVAIIFLKIRFFFQFFSIFVNPQFKFHKFHQAEDY